MAGGKSKTSSKEMNPEGVGWVLLRAEQLIAGSDLAKNNMSL